MNSESAVLVPLNEIKNEIPFISLFPIKQELLDTLIQKMKEHGFDQTQAVHIWKEPFIMIDGHTRLEACRRAGIEQIPAYLHSFSSEAEAVQYAWSLQMDRRNMSDKDIFTFVSRIDLKNLPGKGKTRNKLAALLHISPTKAQNILTIMSRSTLKQNQEILSGKKSVNRVYQELKTTENTEQNNTTPVYKLKELLPKIEELDNDEFKRPWNRPRDVFPLPDIDNKNLMQTYMILKECAGRSSFHKGILEGFELALKLMQKEAGSQTSLNKSS